jgi:7-carboxy-7-deazaguanine synthase
MKISELFYSIQGEGKRTGKPSFFIRTNYCNLRCSFSGGNYCDTPYTSWEPDNNDNIGEFSIAEIVNEFRKYNSPDIVITGGEPTIYQEELENLCSNLKMLNESIYITIETNGTNFGKFTDYIDLISISPKLSSSTPFDSAFEKMHTGNRLNYEALRKFNELHKLARIDIQWKFVFTGDNDISEIKEIQNKIGISNEDIYLMPEGISREDLEQNRLKTIEACLNNKFNYTDRIHILAWDTKRGV